MRMDIQFVKMSTSESLEAYIIKKLSKIEEKFDFVIAATVYIKHENDPKGKGKICEMELSLNGPRLFASSNRKNYEAAVKETLKELETQLKKRKAIMKPY